MTDLSLRQAQPSRAGAQGDDDYDVIVADGTVIGRIFKATTSPGVGTLWMWAIAYGNHEGRTPAHMGNPEPAGIVSAPTAECDLSGRDLTHAPAELGA